MFTIVTHHAPDLDAITSVWLIKRFLPNWQNANVAFVPAGKTLNEMIVDSDPHIWHVDTGFGRLDHHQTDADTCAAKLVYEYIKGEINRGADSRRSLSRLSRDGNNNKRGDGFWTSQNDEGRWQDEALVRIVDVVNFYDHFGEAKLPDATADYHVFDAVSIIDGFKFMLHEDDGRMVDTGFILLDSIYKMTQEKVWAEEIIDQDGIKFESRWGKAIAFETLNDAVLKVSQKMGYLVAVRKDPKKGYVRIKGMPGSNVDFTKAYEVLKKKDPQATWFLHASKKILLNGTTKNPDMRPTKLSLNEIIEVLKKK